MKISKVKIASLVFITLTTVACGGDKNDTTTENTNSTDMTSTPTDVDNPIAGTSDPTGRLDGTWVSACNFAEREIAIFSGDSFEILEEFFLDENCTEPDTEETAFKFAGSIEFPAGSTQTELGTAYWINRTLEIISDDGVPLSGDSLLLANETGAFNTQYDIFLISSDEKLFFGVDDFDLALQTPETRPTQLDTGVEYTRQ